MDAGCLRELVTIERPVLLETVPGVPQRTWMAVQTVWAALEPLSLRDLLFSTQLTVTASHRVTMRYGVPVTLQSRLRLADDRLLMVVSLRNVNERDRWLELLVMFEQAGTPYTT